LWANRGQLAAHLLPLHDLASFCFLPKYCNLPGHLTQDILAKLKETVQMSAVAAFIGHLSNNTGTEKKTFRIKDIPKIHISLGIQYNSREMQDGHSIFTATLPLSFRPDVYHPNKCKGVYIQ